jgi:hypothetical protein
VARRRASGCVAWLLLACLAQPNAARAQPLVEADPVEVRAAYLLNFLRFTQWPAGIPVEQPLDVAVLGAEPLAAALRTLLRQPGATGSRTVRVHPLRELASARARRVLRDAEVVFVGSSEWPDPSDLLAQLRGRPVLTVGEGPEFARRGGMLGLVPQGSRIVFDANPAMIQASGLQLSAKVLKLARIVEEAPNG